MFALKDLNREIVYEQLFDEEQRPVDYKLVRARMDGTETWISLGVVSSGYLPIRSEDAVNTTVSALSSSGYPVKKVYFSQQLFSTREIILLDTEQVITERLFEEDLPPNLRARLSYDTSPGESDKVGIGVEIINSYNGRVSLRIVAGVIRIVCLNGLIYNTKEASITLRHYAKPHVFKAKLSEGVERTVNTLDNLVSKVDLLRDRIFVESDVVKLAEEFVDLGVPKRPLMRIIELFKERTLQKLTAWMLLNLLTYELTYSRTFERNPVARIRLTNLITQKIIGV